jgi:protein TonB
MGNRRYLYSFLITVILYSLFIYGAYTLNFKTKQEEKNRPKIVKIALIAPPPTPHSTPKPKKDIQKKSLVSKPQKLLKPKRIKNKKRVKQKSKLKKLKHKKSLKIKKNRNIKRRVKKIKKRKKSPIKSHKKRIEKKRAKINHNYRKKVIKRVKRQTPKPLPTPKEIIKEYEVVEYAKIENIYQPVEIETKSKKVTQTSKRLNKNLNRNRTENDKKSIIIPTPKQNIQNSSSSKKNLNRQKSSFLSNIRETINSNKIYPRRAKRMGIEGVVRVTFDIDSNGNVLNIRATNAPTILKKAVIKAVKNSFPVDIPESLKELFPLRNISVKIFFKLN